MIGASEARQRADPDSVVGALLRWADELITAAADRGAREQLITTDETPDGCRAMNELAGYLVPHGYFVTYDPYGYQIMVRW